VFALAAASRLLRRPYLAVDRAAFGPQVPQESLLPHAIDTMQWIAHLTCVWPSLNVNGFVLCPLVSVHKGLYILVYPLALALPARPWRLALCRCRVSL
jgi:hypothetical protein